MSNEPYFKTLWHFSHFNAVEQNGMSFYSPDNSQLLGRFYVLFLGFDLKMTKMELK